MDRIPSGWMKEKERPAGNGQPVPDKVQTANVMQLVAQNIFEAGRVLLKAIIGEENGWTNPSECCRRGNASQHQES